VKEACSLISQQQNEKALEIFAKLTSQSKIQYVLTPHGSQENAELDNQQSQGK